MTDLIKISPRGYCYGVVDAIELAKKVAADPATPRPIYVLGQIVHNKHAVADLEQLGIQTLDGPSRLEMLDRIDSGTVIFTAHGVSPAVKQRARDKGLHCVDATCPDVTRTHDLIRDRVGKGHTIIYIGKKGHPEPEGAMGEAQGHVHLVETMADVEALAREHPELADVSLSLVTQTTLSQWDTQALIEELRRRYPRIEVHNEICLATQLRQEAAVKQGGEADVVVVVGDQRSNNSNRLVQVVREIAGKPAVLVEKAEDLDPAVLAGKSKVAVTSGSSTPTRITREVIRRIEDLGRPGGDGGPPA